MPVSTETTVWNQGHCWCDTKPTSSFEICIQCTFSSAQLSPRHGELEGIFAAEKCHKWLRRRVAFKNWHFLCSQRFDLAMWTSYFQQEKKPTLPTETGRAVTWLKSAWFLTPVTKTSCSHLSCFIMNPGGLKNILTHHVSLLTSGVFHRKRLVYSGYNFFD